MGASWRSVVQNGPQGGRSLRWRTKRFPSRGHRGSGVPYVTPVVALVLGVAFRNDEVEPAGSLGCACVALATVVVSRERR